MGNGINQQFLTTGINKQSIHAGLTQKEAMNNAVLSAIFNNLDADGNKTLDENEVSNLKDISLSSDGVYSVVYGSGTAKYNANGQCTHVEYEDGTTITNTYDENGCVSEYSDGGKFFFDKNGKLKKSISTYGITNVFNDDGSFVSTTADGKVCYYDKNNKFYKAVYPDGVTMERIYNADETYVDKYSDGAVSEFDKNGNIKRETFSDGRSFRFEHSENGEYTKYDENNSEHIIHHKRNDDGTFYDIDSYGNVANYDKDGRWSNGKDKNGSYAIKYNEDGTFEQWYTEGKRVGTVFYFDKQGHCVRRVNPDSSSYRFERGEKGNYTSINEKTDEKTFWNFSKDGTYTTTHLDGTKEHYDYSSNYTETSRSDGSIIYKSFDGVYAEKNKKGEIKTFARKGESFADTMKRLGITAEEDIKLFIKANKKAFKAGAFNSHKMDIVIPPELSSKVKIANVMKPSMGL